MPDATSASPKTYQCRHLFTDGHRCGSKSLRHEQFCFYHHKTRKPFPKAAPAPPADAIFDLPFPEDRAAIQLSIGEILQRIARNQIDPRRAGLLLYGLQIASCNLPKAEAEAPGEVVEDLETHPEYGPLARIAEYTAPSEPVSFLDTLFRGLGLPSDDDDILPTLQATGQPDPGAPGQTASPSDLGLLDRSRHAYLQSVQAPRTMFGTRYPLLSHRLATFPVAWQGTQPHTQEERAKVATGPNVSQYSRQDVLRILDLQPRHLAAWEQAGLIPAQDAYSFRDLHQIRALRDLQATKISVSSISRSIVAMQRVSGMANPLLEATIVRRGSSLAFRHAGSLVDPITRQLAFDFDLTVKFRQLRVLRTGESTTAIAMELQELFHRAVRLEEDPGKRDDAIAIYHQVLARDPNHAPACINLGTIHYTQRDFAAAEAMYRRATIADPDYALAFFDLGNVLDELQHLPQAIAAYERAVTLVPGYADAHYNLALAYERKGERRRALRHWRTYIRLDPIGPWASHARDQTRKILSTERLTLVTRTGSPV